MEATKVFSAAPEEVARARAFVRAFAGEACLSDRCDDLELLTSELVTNAVLYGRGPIEVHVEADERRVRVDVVNDGCERPELREPSPAERTGRGLLLVDQLSTAWGAACERDRTKVWVEVMP